jgi:hypothetical membrane protein
MSSKAAGFYGILATLWFATALLVFADIYPGYAHATKAISELGAIGAPHQHAWNVIGFLVPGILLAFHGWGLGVVAGDRIAGAGFCLSGLSFAATCIPANMDDFSAPASQAHIAASLAVFVFWLAGALRLTMGGPAASKALMRATTACLWLAAAAALVRFSGLVFPGTGQRIAFAGHFAWVLSTALILLVHREQDQN